MNSIGLAAPGSRAIATLWRHLAQWPGLLAVIHAAFAPLHREGTIQRSIHAVHGVSQAEGARITHLRSEHIVMPDTVRKMITRYATSPEGVVGMVTKGHVLAKWLQPGDSTG